MAWGALIDRPRRWRFGYNNRGVFFRLLAVACMGFAIVAIVTANDGDELGAGIAFLATGVLLFVITQWVAARNFVELDDETGRVVVKAEGVRHSASFADSVFVIPRPSWPIPKPVMFETDAGANVRCALMSQGRFVTPLGLRLFRRALAQRNIRTRAPGS